MSLTSVSNFNGATINAKATAVIVAYRALTLASVADDFITAAHATTGTAVHGFSQTAADAIGDAVGVAVDGIGIVEVNGDSSNIAAGDFLKVGTATGILIKATSGDTYVARALEPASTDGAKIQAHIIVNGYNAVLNGGATVSGTTGTVTQAQVDGRSYTVVCSNNGVCALAIPAAAAVSAGTRLIVYKSGTAGAVTITPATGTIAGGANLATIDAQNDRAEFIPIGTNWVILASTIA
jgi:hypothetical protein